NFHSQKHSQTKGTLCSASSSSRFSLPPTSCNIAAARSSAKGSGCRFFRSEFPFTETQSNERHVMFGIKFIKVQPTTYLLQYRGGQVVREGLGLSFFPI